jgi:photosystem II stability/assembly factor-like uncharacterized protein
MKIISKVLLSLIIGTVTLHAQYGWVSAASTTDWLSTVCFADSLNGWVGGTLQDGVTGVIRKTSDGGTTWTSQTLPVTFAINKIKFLTPTTGFACGEQGTILKTTNAGQTWVKKSSGTSENVSSIFFLTTQLGWACTPTAVLLTKDGGDTWSRRPVPKTTAKYDIAFKNALEGMLVSNFSLYFKTTDGGQTWLPIDPPNGYSAYFGVQYLSPTRIVLAGWYLIAASADNGSSWSTIPFFEHPIQGLCFADSLTGWVIDDWRIYISNDGGSRWKLQSAPSDIRLGAIHSPDVKHAWAVGIHTILKMIYWAGTVSYSTSTITGSPLSIKADGQSTSTITIQLNDPEGINVTTSGGPVVMTTTLGTLGPVTDLKNGTYTAVLTSSTAFGYAIVRATVNGQPLTTAAGVNFVDVGPSGSYSTLTSQDQTIAADGQSTTLISVQIKDVFGVNFTKSAGALVLTTTLGTIGSVTDHQDGTYTAVLTSSLQYGMAAVTGVINGVLLTTTAAVQFLGPFDPTVFPLSIGNKWFYRYVSFIDKGRVDAGLIVREIISSVSERTRTVEVTSSLKDGIKTSIEYWQYRNGCFYISSTPALIGYVPPLYDVNLLHDTGVPGGSVSVSVTELTYFGERYKTQFRYEFSSGHIAGGSTSQGIAAGIGLTYRSNYSYIIPYSSGRNSDTLSLIGFVKNGILYGDSSLTVSSDTIAGASLAMYYPLQTGNMWQHKVIRQTGSSTTSDTMTTRIRMDTVINNMHYAVVEKDDDNHNYYFARFDTATGCYYELPPGATSEVLKDSTKARLPGAYSWGRLSIGYLQAPFGIPLSSRVIEKNEPSPNDTSRFYSVWGIGKHKTSTGGISQSSEETIFYARINGREYGSLAGDTLWRVQPSGTSNRLRGACIVNATTRVAVGERGTILRTTDGGKTWLAQSAGTQMDLNGACFTNVNSGIAVGNYGTILRTTNGGSTWKDLSTGTGEWLWKVRFIGPNNGTIVGMNGGIFRTTNGGASWTHQTSGTTNALFDVSWVDANIGTAVGAGVILRTTNGGATWTSQTNGVPTSVTYYGVSFMNADTGIAVGDYCTILRTADGGATWTVQTNGLDAFAYFYGVSFTNANTGFVVGSSGIIYKTTDGGITWNRHYTSTSNHLQGVSFYDVNTGMVVGDYGTIFSYSGRDSLTSTRPDNGQISDSTNVIPQTIDHYALDQNYPNPFNPTTTIGFTIPYAGHVSLTVFDIIGREVAVLVNEELAAGTYAREWDGLHFPTGVYFYRLQAGTYVETRKLVVLK